MFRRLRRHTRGTVSLELCLMSPLILFMFIGIFDMGFLVFQQMEVQAAADAGAAFAFAQGTTNWNHTTIESVVASTAYPTQTAITGSATWACACPNSTNTGIVGVAGTPPNGCSTQPKCSNGIDAPGVYALVSAQATPTPIFNWPGYPAQVKSGVVVRLK